MGGLLITPLMSNTQSIAVAAAVAAVQRILRRRRQGRQQTVKAPVWPPTPLFECQLVWRRRRHRAAAILHGCSSRGGWRRRRRGGVTAMTPVLVVVVGAHGGAVHPLRCYCEQSFLCTNEREGGG